MDFFLSTSHNGDGRVESDGCGSYTALGHNSTVFHLSLIFPSVSW